MHRILNTIIFVVLSNKSCLVDKPTDIASEPEKDIREESLKVSRYSLLYSSSSVDAS